MKGKLYERLRRLALAVLSAALLSVIFDAAMSARGVPTPAEMMTPGSGMAFIAMICVFVIPSLYLISVGADKIGLACWIVFPILFVALNAGYSYFSLSALDQYELGGQTLVAGRQLTSFGWTCWEQNTAGVAAIALIADIILFGWPSRWLRTDS